MLLVGLGTQSRQSSVVSRRLSVGSRQSSVGSRQGNSRQCWLGRETGQNGKETQSRQLAVGRQHTVWRCGPRKARNSRKQMLRYNDELGLIESQVKSQAETQVLRALFFVNQEPRTKNQERF